MRVSAVLTAAFWDCVRVWHILASIGSTQNVYPKLIGFGVFRYSITLLRVIFWVLRCNRPVVKCIVNGIVKESLNIRQLEKERHFANTSGVIGFCTVHALAYARNEANFEHKCSKIIYQFGSPVTHTHMFEMYKRESIGYDTIRFFVRVRTRRMATGHCRPCVL